MLEELCKQDELWRHYAFKICGCRDKADDLVQEMYLRFSNKLKQINKGYVFKMIRSVYIDELRKQQDIINIDDLFLDLTEDNKESLENRFELLDILKSELTFFEREVLLLTHEYSLRDAELVTGDEKGENGVPYYTLNYYKKKGLKKLKDKYGKRTG